MAIEIKIDGYDSFEQIAVGGMAAVYKARRISIDKIVAIKVLFPYLASDTSFIDRFQREAKSAAKVQHENIVNVVDFGESDGCYYIVMEFYEGVTVADLLTDGPRIPVDIAAAVLLDVCLGLEAAHAKDIVHRDIKPANIIYTNHGGIKIADFGLAKKSDTMTVVTQPGKVLGTPAYMSPEQAAGDSVGPQSDIFSLGVVAFEMFCQKRPFEGSSYSEVLEKIQTHDVPPLSQENPLVQPSFERIVARMLEKDLSKRYDQIVDVISDLERAMEAQGIKRDRRRLQKYIKNPEQYERAFNEKMVARCLSQGTYFMQKGKTHLSEAKVEFRRILYLEPTNERARLHLAKIVSETGEGDSTVALDAAKSRARKAADGKRSKKEKRGNPPHRPQGALRRWVRPLVMSVLGAAGVFAAWWGWTSLASPRPTNTAPQLSSPSRLTVSEGETVEFRLDVADADGDSIRVYGNELPAGAELSASGVFSWTVGFDQEGEHSIEFFADDGAEIARAKTTIDVIDKLAKLEFEKPKPQTAVVGKSVSVRLQAASTLGNPVAFSLQNEPEGMRIDGNKLIWTPREDQTGTHNVAVKGSDGVADATETVVVQVKPVPPKKVRRPQKGKLDWILPRRANIYVDGELHVRQDTYLSIELAEGEHTVRAELLDGMTVFEKVVDIRGGQKTALDTPELAYGQLSVYFLGGDGEFLINGKAFKEQPPFTAATVPVGMHRVSCKFRDGESREFSIVVKENENTVIEYEIGNEPTISYEQVDE